MVRQSGADEQLERVVEAVVERLGFVLVDLERAGHRSRPILRLRIDREDATPGGGVTVDECARVSRELEQELESRDELLASYILEVSSPGVERVLRKRRDFERSVGREVALRGFEPLAKGSKRIEGVLVGVEGSAANERLVVRLTDGDEVEIYLSSVAKANLVFRWDESGLGKVEKDGA
jgi:ribosome maturation factor RimP